MRKGKIRFPDFRHFNSRGDVLLWFMPKHLHIAIVVFIIALLASCTMEGPSSCEGFLTVIKSIPDITMAVGDTIYVDLTNPRIFKIQDNDIVYSFTPVTSINAYIGIRVNPYDSNQLSLIEIIGRNSRESIYQINAASGCLENYTLLNITVQ